MKKLYIFLAIAVISILSSCRAAHINNIGNTSTSESFAYSYTTEQVRTAIIAAVEKRGWRVVEENKDLIVSQYSKGRYSATVNIFYTANYYNINYKNSINLEYNGDTINRHYNDWVEKLSKEIQAQLIEIANPPTKKSTYKVKTNLN